jgi:tetratricopeptide (TPR) repeat protein
MGRAYQDNERKDEAGACYDRGIEWAEKSLETGDSAEGWQILAANISQNCVVKSASWALGNGLKVERYSKNTLKLDSRNVSAKYMIAARWVFAPAPFHNLKRGIQMMEDILKEHETVMQKDDLFNVYSAIGYAYLRQKNNSGAKPWLEKSLEIFPTNKFVGNLLKNAN